METWLEEALESVDAGIFSGDTFESADNRKELREYMARWEKALKEIEVRDADL